MKWLIINSIDSEKEKLVIQLRLLKINEIKSVCLLIKYGNCGEIVIRGSQRHKQQGDEKGKNQLKQKLTRQIEEQVLNELIKEMEKSERLEKVEVKNVELNEK